VKSGPLVPFGSNAPKSTKDYTMNEVIVYLTTQDITKAEPITDSRFIAEEFGMRHGNVIRKIDSLIKTGETEFFARLKIESGYYPDANNQQRKMYLLNEAQTMFLIMGFTGKKASSVKDRFIKQFQSMRRELLVREGTRQFGKEMRMQLTNTIDKSLEDGTNHKKFAFSNYSRLIYKRVLGRPVKQLKEDRGLKECHSLRDNLTREELTDVQDKETEVAGMINTLHKLGLNDKEIYAKVKEMI